MCGGVKSGVGAVILAAGSSSRMGRPKQIIQFRGESLLRRAVLAALAGGCAPVVVVVPQPRDCNLQFVCRRMIR